MVKETLRFATPVVNPFPRVVPPEGVHVQGNFIPGGVSPLLISVFHKPAVRLSALFLIDRICMVHHRGLQAQQHGKNGLIKSPAELVVAVVLIQSSESGPQ